MSEFDDHDHDLERRLRAAAGADPDVAAARQAIAGRVVRARRRRVAVVSGATAALIVSIGVVATVGNDDQRRIQSATPPTDSVTVDVSDPSTTATLPSTTSGSTQSATTVTVPTTSLPTATPVVPSVSASPTTVLPGGEAPAPPTSTTIDTSSTSSTAPPTSTEPTAPPPADVTETFPSLGGTITVRLSGGQLQLLSVIPADGYETERQIEKPDDVEVRFVSGNAESRIRVRIIDGQMSHEIDEQ
jgi:hypothetical protein